jgi:GTP-binding protein
MSFVDEVEIHVAAGHGGKGAMSFRREKFVPRGGPDGGDGGHGGSVFLVARANLNTLLNFRFQKIFEARNGSQGEGSLRTGKSGADITLEVPVGTQVFEKQGDEYVRIADLTAEGEPIVIAKGGLGGQGNARYATSTNRAPRRTQPGLPGEEKDLRLQLKLLADVGIVGFPNAGKSTLISRISAAKPKIADYPFTTLTPNLGVVGLSGDRSFVAADVPGLIEGAHEGLGLGHRFLSHLERTRVLVHVVDVSSATGRDPVEDYGTITRELALFPGRDAAGERLQDKPVLVAANKIDALDDPSRLERLRAHLRRARVPLYAISAATGEGLPQLLEAIWTRLVNTQLPTPNPQVPTPNSQVPAPNALRPALNSQAEGGAAEHRRPTARKHGAPARRRSADKDAGTGDR